MASADKLALRRWSKRLQQDVHRAEVGGVGVQDQRLAGNADRVRDARRLCGPALRCWLMTACVRSTEAESGNCTLRSR